MIRWRLTSSLVCAAWSAGSTLEVAGFLGVLVAAVSAAIVSAGAVANSANTNKMFFIRTSLPISSSAARQSRRDVRVRRAPTGEQCCKRCGEQRRDQQPELLRRERPCVDGDAFLLRHPPRKNGGEAVRQQQAEHAAKNRQYQCFEHQ